MAKVVSSLQGHLNELCGVSSRRQQADEGTLGVALRPGTLHVQRDRLHKPLTQSICNVVCSCNEGTILSECLHTL